MELEQLRKLYLESQKANSCILMKNNEEELKLNYTKIYDLSLIDKIENITQEEKVFLFSMIKKVLLSTNNYILSFNNKASRAYYNLTMIIYLLFNFIYYPIYRYFFISEENSFEEPSKQRIFIIYMILEICEMVYKFLPKSLEEKKILKIMKIYAKSLMFQNENDTFKMNIDDKFNIYIMRKEFFKDVLNMNKKQLPLNVKNDFYDYVINYPNTYNFLINGNILNEKENEIFGAIIQARNLVENEVANIYKLFIICLILVYVQYFNNLIKGNIYTICFYRFIIFVIDLIYSLFLSNHLKKNFTQKQEMLSKQYIPFGYFIVLNFHVYQIFKLKDEYIDKALNIDETYEKINKDIFNLNNKVIENIFIF